MLIHRKIRHFFENFTIKLILAMFLLNDNKAHGPQKQVGGSIHGVDPTKLFFFDNEEFFRFLLVSFHFCYIQNKIIDSKMTYLNAEEKKRRKKSLV